MQSELSPLMLQKNNYRKLCELYSRYKPLVNKLYSGDNFNGVSPSVLKKLDSIISEVVNFPISWKFYRKSSYKFSSDFEDIVVFN